MSPFILAHFLLWFTFLTKRIFGDFVNLRKQGYFVDKSNLIRTFFAEDFENAFITCPRGFGKSSNLQMLRLFLEIELDTNHNVKHPFETTAYEVFKDLAIFSRVNLIKKHMARYPVIYLDLKAEKHTKNLMEFLDCKLYEGFYKYKWLLNLTKEELFSRNVNEANIIDEEHIRFLRLVIGRQLNHDYDILEALVRLMNTLSIFFQRAVVLLIDNYDSVLINSAELPKSQVQRYYRCMRIILHRVVHSHQPLLAYSLISSTSGIALPKIMNLFPLAQHYHCLDGQVITPHFGFDKHEVSRLLDTYHLPQTKLKDLKSWYNGYQTQTGVPLYNPSSITRYLAQSKEHDALQEYWNEPEADEFLVKFLHSEVFREEVNKLVSTEEIQFNEKTSYNRPDYIEFLELIDIHKNMTKQSFANVYDTLFTFIWEQGYLTKIPNKDGNIRSNDTESDPIRGRFFITNKEIKSVMSKILNRR